MHTYMYVYMYTKNLFLICSHKCSQFCREGKCSYIAVLLLLGIMQSTPEYIPGIVIFLHFSSNKLILAH